MLLLQPLSVAALAFVFPSIIILLMVLLIVLLPLVTSWSLLLLLEPRTDGGGLSTPCVMPWAVPGKNNNSSHATPFRRQVRKEKADIMRVKANNAGPVHQERKIGEVVIIRQYLVSC